MKNHIPYLICALISLFTIDVYTQNPQWIVYDTINSDLPSSWIYCMKVDESNTKWISTHTYTGFGSHHGNGLTKFENSDWTTYDTLNSGLPSNTVVDIAVDSEENKWIATQYHWGPGWIFRGGLAKFDGSTWNVYDTSNSGIPTNDLSYIAIDDLDNKWIGTIGQGLIKFDGTNWTIYNTSNSGLPGNFVGYVTVDGSGNVWMDSEGLVKFDGINWTIFNTAAINCIEFDFSGNIWIGTYQDGLHTFDGINWIIYDTTNSGIPSNQISCIAFDNSDNKWIGTSEGLVKFDDTNWAVYNESNSGLSNNGIECIAIDEYANKWIGTYAGGLAIFNENGVVSIDQNKIFNNILPKSHILHQNFPNPFNPTTTIEFELPKTGDVTLKILNILGEEVTTLVSEMLSAGSYSFNWNASQQASGVYLYRLQTGEYVETKKMVLIK